MTTQSIQEVIARAKAAAGCFPGLALYTLKDRQEVQDAGLAEMAGVFYYSKSGSIATNDVLFLIERLEHWMKSKE